MSGLRENEWEDKLKDLPLYRVYENLDRGLAHGEDWGDCSQLGSFNSEATTLCKKMARNLRELAGTHKINNRRDKCYYLQHWLYYKTRLLTSNMSSSNKYMIISRLREIAKRINAKVLDKIRCECYFLHENYWKIDKDLHDYFKNFDHIKCDSSDKEKCKKFIDYVTYINKLYKADKDYCCYGGLVDEDSCLPYFKCDPSYDPNDLLKNLKSAIGESHRIQVAKGGPAVDERASSRRYQNSYMSRGRNEEEHVAYINTHDHAHEGTDGFSHMIGTMGNMLRSNIVYRSIAAVTIVGILIFCFYYVKANPFGSKSNKRKRGKDEFLDSEEDAYEEEFPPNELDHSFGDSQMGSLHMNYYPSHDSYY
ncbi:VIR protein [Plasmodium vivax]|uniref:VIR protein n=1 Tax=Plasmodium vivax TaxID=5855 RepID=A0A1G4H9F3_PLAVI|nr:PIR protein [Plasmodium vivax]SCO71520.1 VIR protein [Plasmodium vivax]